MPRSLQDKLLEAQASNRSCVLVLTDGSKVFCERIVQAGPVVPGEGSEVDVHCQGGTRETFRVEEIEDIRLGAGPSE